MSSQPIPFEIVTQDNGLRVASNGVQQMVCTESDAKVFKRRGISGVSMKSAAETILPQLNQFAGELLAAPMAAKDVVAKLIAISGTVSLAEPQRKEWLVIQIVDVRVFLDVNTVVVASLDV